MKSFIATLTLSVVLLNFSSGQVIANVADVPVQALAIEQTRQMVTYLHFNEYEYIKIRNLNQTHIQDVLNAKAEYTDDAIFLAKKLKAIEEQYDAAILQLLTKEQKASFAEYKKHVAKSPLALN